MKREEEEVVGGLSIVEEELVGELDGAQGEVLVEDLLLDHVASNGRDASADEHSISVDKDVLLLRLCAT